MKIVKTLIVLLAFLGIPAVLLAQDQQDSAKNIQLIEDPNIKLFYPSKPTTTTTNVGNKGFRVQIYDGNNRTKASEVKVAFMKKYPGVRSYIKFHNPQYRVRVGDFTTREDAEAFQEKIKKDFFPSMIIPDLINVGGGKPTSK